VVSLEGDEITPTFFKKAEEMTLLFCLIDAFIGLAVFVPIVFFS